MDRDQLARLLCDAIGRHERYGDAPWPTDSCDYSRVCFGGDQSVPEVDMLAVADDVLAAMKET